MSMITWTKFRDVPISQTNGCYVESTERWEELRGTPIRIVASPRPLDKIIVADGVARCTAPHFRCPDLWDPTHPLNPIVLCAHVIEVD